jgi:6-phosphogluconate dehydrogenase
VGDFLKCFSRESAGNWTCRRACEIELPSGRIQVAVNTRFTAGTKFMDVDIAEMLDQEYRKASQAAASARA